MNSDTHFDNNGITVLLRILESNNCEAREKWWTEIRACRRRRQISLDGSTPLVTVFNTENEFDFMEFKAIVARVQCGLQERGLLIFDAFRAINSSNSGLITCSELYGGLDYLNIPFTPQQVYDLVKKISLLNEVIFITNLYFNKISLFIFDQYIIISLTFFNHSKINNTFYHIIIYFLTRDLFHMMISNEFFNFPRKSWKVEVEVEVKMDRRLNLFLLNLFLNLLTSKKFIFFILFYYYY
jgi:hypothetical protein